MMNKAIFPWEETFVFSKRHCWPNKNGIYILDGTFDEVCPNPEEHPYWAGQSEFMRWIREFAVLAPGIVTGFEDGWLKLGEDITFNHKSCYCENYGGILKAFLMPKEGIAIVEIYDTDLFAKANQACETVSESFR